MDVAFRLVRGGAELLAMHRNPWWLTPKGETLDAGAYVAGWSSRPGRRARILGKPSPDVFRQAVAGLVADLGERAAPVRPSRWSATTRADVAAAQRVGLRGFLVLSGKSTAADVETCRGRRAADLTAWPPRWPRSSPR